MKARESNMKNQAKKKWHPIASAPQGQLVDTCIDADQGTQRNEAPLTRKGRLWFLKDWSMYVYYTPTHWRPR